MKPLEVREFLRPAMVDRPVEYTPDGDVLLSRRTRALIHASSPVGGRFIAEFEDGKMRIVDASDVTFTDSMELFGEYAWEGR